MDDIDLDLKMMLFELLPLKRWAQNRRPWTAYYSRITAPGHSMF